MRLHGGRIGISCEGEGKGTTFLVDLPVLRYDSVGSGVLDSSVKVEKLSLNVSKQYTFNVTRI
jgi:hypothetical protein